MTPDDFAALVSRVSKGRYPKIPTAVGFCMLITRRTLDQVGKLDSAFGHGYGEENDFSMRIRKLGIEIACCDDAYVHHYGEASFSFLGEIDNRRRQNNLLLSQKWPDYIKQVLSFCRRNPLRDLQETIYHEVRRKKKDKSSILQVIHNFEAPAGTELHTQNIVEGLASRFHSTVIFPSPQPTLWSDLTAVQKSESLRIVRMAKENAQAQDLFVGFSGDLSSRGVEEKFARFLIGGDYEIVHFQHLADWNSLLLPFIAKALHKKVVLSLHDYYLLCPEYNFLLPGTTIQCGKMRGDESDPECLYCLGAKRICLSRNPMPLERYLEERNEIIREMIGIADAIIAPSNFVRDCFIRVFGESSRQKFLVIPHGMEPLGKSLRPARTKTLRVGFLGSATDRKGIWVYLKAAAALKGKPVQFEIFGRAPVSLGQTLSNLNIRIHGRYERNNLPTLLNKTDLVVIPSVWDETYCLTPRVSEAQAMGVPVLASRCGAIAERIEEGKTGFLFRLEIMKS